MSNNKMQLTVWVIRNDRPTEVTYQDLFCYVHTTSRPDGVGTKYYVRENDDGFGLYQWVTYGGPEMLVRQFDDEASAISAVEDMWIYDIENNTEEAIFHDQSEVQAFIDNNLNNL